MTVNNQKQLNVGDSNTKLILTELNKPYFIMMVGFPGSGKSYYAENNITIVPHDEWWKLMFDSNYVASHPCKPIIHSSDRLRHELYGDAAIQKDHQTLFNKLHKNIIHDLEDGKSVIYDATNIKKSLRIDFLNRIKKIECQKICIVMATPFDDCKTRCAERPVDEFRTQQVPANVVQRMYFNYMPPHTHEGFDNIIYIFNKEQEYYKSFYDTQAYMDRVANFDQENSHHTLTLGEHSLQALDFVQRALKEINTTTKAVILELAALLHDNGKVETKTRLNFKGINDGECHYYQHQCVGAYNALFYGNVLGLDSDELSDLCNLIYYHMHPYMSWNKSEKSRNRDLNLLGESMFDSIMLLHEADVAAH